MFVLKSVTLIFARLPQLHNMHGFHLDNDLLIKFVQLYVTDIPILLTFLSPCIKTTQIHSFVTNFITKI